MYCIGNYFSIFSPIPFDNSFNYNNPSYDFDMAYPSRFWNITYFFPFNALYGLGATILFSITVYAYIYFKHGLYLSGAPYNGDFFDSLYFSITTWTTLGYGDLARSPKCRLATSVEALTGYFSMAVFIVLTGLFITDGTKTVRIWFDRGKSKEDKEKC